MVGAIDILVEASNQIYIYESLENVIYVLNIIIHCPKCNFIKLKSCEAKQNYCSKMTD